VDDVGVIYYRFPVIDAMVQVTQVGCKLKDSPDGSTYLMWLTHQGKHRIGGGVTEYFVIKALKRDIQGWPKK